MVCAACGKSNHEAATYCRHCGALLATAGALADAQPRQAPSSPSTLPPTGNLAFAKSPVAAVFFSLFIPGLGQFYNGDFKRGILALIVVGVVIFFAPTTACLSTVLLIPVWIWGTINAYNVAARKTPLWI